MSAEPGPATDSSKDLDSADFERFVELNGGLGKDRRSAALRAVSNEVARELDSGGNVLARFPPAVHEAMGAFGWLWNGFYLHDPEEGQLVLGPASGPPVCGILEGEAGLFRSGMCFDGLRMNQALVSREGSKWPGYVSCDGASGLSTVASIVVPIRDPEGRPFGVWDLDATKDVEPGDVRFMDVLLSSLGRFTDLTRWAAVG